ncbi:MAG: hypothetical protein ACRDGA_09465, partial [Bacteroidota bacterium]
MNTTNRTGYDNQPSFLPDGSGILYTAIHNEPPGPHAPTQADIFLYDFVRKKNKRITSTEESEYSAAVMPEGMTFSVVRVEPDSTQRLWKFAMSGENPSIVLHNVQPVGYHAWVDSKTVALFVLGNPPTLQLANIKSGEAEVIEANIGRSLHKIPGRQSVSFVHKVSQGEWWIKELDVVTRAVMSIVRTLEGSEDYAWTPDGTIIMGQGSKLFCFAPGRSNEWTEIADFSSLNVKGIT